SLDRSTTARPRPCTATGAEVLRHTPSFGIRKPVAGRHGSLALLRTWACGISVRSMNSTPFAVITLAPRAPFGWNTTWPSRLSTGEAQPPAGATRATAAAHLLWIPARRTFAGRIIPGERGLGSVTHDFAPEVGRSGRRPR